jgi:hypothetical protein
LMLVIQLSLAKEHFLQNLSLPITFINSSYKQTPPQLNLLVLKIKAFLLFNFF